MSIKIDEGLWTKLRIDNNTFHYGSRHLDVGFAKGVIDHNRFFNPHMGINFSAGSRALANEDWKSLEAGTKEALFIEDNLWIRNSDWGFGHSSDFCLDTDNGGKFVMRYNEYEHDVPQEISDPRMPFIQLHGNDQNYWQYSPTANRGQSVVECYGNYTHGRRIGAFFVGRSGSLLIYNNRIQRTGIFGTKIYFYDEENNSGHGWTLFRTEWPAEDQVNNTFIWGNSFDGAAQTSSDISATPPFMQLGRDYFLHEPQETGGREYFECKPGITHCNGASNTYPTDGDTYPTFGTMMFTSDGPNAHYPYVPYKYPHPLTVEGQTGKTLDLQSAETAGELLLTWNPVDNAASYRISRNWEPEFSPTNATSHSEATPTVDSGYVVTAYDRSGKVLAMEGLKILAPSPLPSKPRGLKTDSAPRL
jgi:hypothetical protein